MTTFIGIRTNAGEDAIILMADRQSTNSTDSEKKSITKLYFGRYGAKEEFGYWAMGDAGADDREVRRFYGLLKGDGRYGSNEKRAQKIIDRAIRKQIFLEVIKLNRDIMRSPNSDIEETHCFLMAVNRPDLSLWLIDEFGNFKKPEEDKNFDYICLGSGKYKAEQKIEQLIADEEIDRDKITPKAAISIGRKALGMAESDLSTGMGYDLLIMTKRRLDNWGKIIRKELSEHEEKRLSEIAEQYKSESVSYTHLTLPTIYSV